MTISEQVLNEINRGRQGKNKGIPMGLPKMESVIDGVTKETYTLIISSSGAGKTSYALYAYVYKPIMHNLDDENFKVLYFSLEMSATALFIKLLSIYIFEQFGVELSYKELLSRKREYVLSDEHYDLVQKCMPWIDKISNHIEIYDKALNANIMTAVLKTRMDKLGTFTETGSRTIYTPNNPDLTYVVVLDHIALLRPQAGHTLKQEIDLASSVLVSFRDRCGISPVVIQQANRDTGNLNRTGKVTAEFTVNDSKDSGNTVQDCNIMIGINYPYRDRIANFRDYNINKLKHVFRGVTILKNRYGDCDVMVGMAFYGQINTFVELPNPNEMMADESYEYLTPKFKQ